MDSREITETHTCAMFCICLGTFVGRILHINSKNHFVSCCRFACHRWTPRTFSCRGRWRLLLPLVDTPKSKCRQPSCSTHVDGWSVCPARSQEEDSGPAACALEEGVKATAVDTWDVRGCAEKFKNALGWVKELRRLRRDEGQAP